MGTEMELQWRRLVATLARDLQKNDALRLNGKDEMIFPRIIANGYGLVPGLGCPIDSSAENPNPNFDNVFVSPDAYHSFVSSGIWPTALSSCWRFAAPADRAPSIKRVTIKENSKTWKPT